MNEFGLYFSLGYEHIADFSGIDHILFIAALCLRYQWQDWKKILVLVTAFTIGHSITLALSALNMVSFSIKWIEFLIPITIIITVISNTLVKQFSFKTKFPIIYFFALFFGLIHGLGFSNYLKSLLGKDENIVKQLLSFNLGLEAGQLLIVGIILLVSFIFVGLLKVNRKDYVLFFSGAIFALAVEMAVVRMWEM